MDQLYYLTRKATEAIEHGVLYLNNDTPWFTNTMPHIREFEEVLRGGSEELLFENEAGNIDEISDDEDELQEEQPEYLGEILFKFCIKRCKALASDFAICGWYFCIVPGVTDDVRGNVTIDHRDAVEHIIKLLYQYSPDVGNFKLQYHNDTCDTLWTKWSNFSNKLDTFSSNCMWYIAPAVSGKIYVFHECNSLKVTKVLGYVVCCVTSKALCIGAAERSWGDVKQLKTGKRSHLSVVAVEQHNIIFGAASMHKAHIGQEEAENLDHAISSKL
jgi:hypothetical protein